MTDLMIYATKDKAGGTVENIWGSDMRVKRIDSSDKEQVEQAKKDGWQKDAQAVIDEIDTHKMQADNERMKDKLSGGNAKREKELEAQLAEALTEIAGLEETVTELKDKVEVYESRKDTNKDGKVDYEEMTNAELQKLLDQRKVDYNKRDGKDALIKLATDSE